MRVKIIQENICVVQVRTALRSFYGGIDFLKMRCHLVGRREEFAQEYRGDFEGTKSVCDCVSGEVAQENIRKPGGQVPPAARSPIQQRGRRLAELVDIPKDYCCEVLQETSIRA